MRKILIVSGLTIATSISTAALGGESLSNSTQQDRLAAMKNEAFSSLKYKMLSEQARRGDDHGNARMRLDVGWFRGASPICRCHLGRRLTQA